MISEKPLNLLHVAVAYCAAKSRESIRADDLGTFVASCKHKRAMETFVARWSTDNIINNYIIAFAVESTALTLSSFSLNALAHR